LNNEFYKSWFPGGPREARGSFGDFRGSPEVLECSREGPGGGPGEGWGVPGVLPGCPRGVPESHPWYSRETSGELPGSSRGRPGVPRGFPIILSFVAGSSSFLCPKVICIYLAGGASNPFFVYKSTTATANLDLTNALWVFSCVKLSGKGLGARFWAKVVILMRVV